MLRILAVLSLLLPAAAFAREELNLFAWSEYVPQKLIDGFTRETGIRVNYETFSSNEEMLSKLLAGTGEYDVIQPTEYAAEALIRAHLLRPIDRAHLANAHWIAPEYLHPAYDPADAYTIPYMSGTVGIVVNTAVVHGPITGYNDVFQPQFAGRIVVVNDNREIVSWALATLGVPPNDITPATLARARPIVARWVKLIKVYDSDSPKTPLLSGDVDLGVVWSGEAAILWNQNHKFRYVLPREGAHRYVDLLAVPANAPHAAAAARFLDYVLRPEVARLICDEFPYTSPNVGARRLLSPQQLANPASYPAADGTRETFRDIGRAAADVDRLLTELKNAP